MRLRVACRVPILGGPVAWHSILLFDRLESLIRTRSGTVSIHLNAFICGRPSLGGHGKCQVAALAEYWNPTRTRRAAA